MDFTRRYDVLVVGGGNAALSAAITARQAGASVLVIEHAPKTMRGGNSRHTRNLRAMHTAPTSVLTDAYLEDEYWDDLNRVTGGQTDEHLARMTIRASQAALPFLEACGVRFQPSLTGTLSLSRTNIIVSYTTEFKVICVVGSPILWPAITPTISPGWTIDCLYFRIIVSNSKISAFR